MKSDPMPRPVLRRTAARAFYLKCSAEWLTGRKQVPTAVIADAERAARAVIARYACQPKAHIKLPAPGRGDTGASIPTNTPN
ncbi:MAG: hypothetical protein K9N23_13735 [Akkermansiaceae bacterium]|nr:hypothetical protein [Akkermansiaceae bacterium]MCF7732745.1 hypothetical protein [Akkermansiaceae bacterium]